MLVKIVLTTVVIVFCHGQLVQEPPQDELFRYADANNDTRLNLQECRTFWLRFDGDGDHIIQKLEFELKWTFLHLNDPTHSPFFFRELDMNMNGEANIQEISRMCNYFDDDGDHQISKQEFDLNWNGLFTLPTASG